MKPLSKPVNSYEEDKYEEIQVTERVDINVLFDSEKTKPDTLAQNEHPVEQYIVENQVNREQRHAFLRRVHITRGLVLVVGLLFVFFLLGIILLITGSLLLQNNHIQENEPRYVHNALPDSSKIIANIIDINETQSINSNNEVIDIDIDLPNVKSGQKSDNKLPDDSISTTKLPISTTTTTTRPTMNTYESEILEELVPDEDTNNILRGILNRLSDQQNEYRLQDLQPSIENIGNFFGRVIQTIPRVRFDLSV